MTYYKGEKRVSTNKINETHLEKLHTMNLHGEYFKQQLEIPNVNIELSNKWLANSYLRSETESLICAAQEQTLATNYLSTKIWKIGNNPTCRLCRKENETIQHIVSGCEMLAATQYTRRHDLIGKYIHWTILKELGAKVPTTWIKHQPKDTVIHTDTTVLWDKPIITHKKVKHNRPDIIIHNTNTRECLLIDIAVPNCTNITKKEAEKITKYRDLEIELQKCWDLKKIRTIPVVIGALGTVSQRIEDNLKQISPNLHFDTIQKTAVLGTAHILRNFLTRKDLDP